MSELSRSEGSPPEFYSSVETRLNLVQSALYGISDLIEDISQPYRAELARRVCEELAVQLTSLDDEQRMVLSGMHTDKSLAASISEESLLGNESYIYLCETLPELTEFQQRLVASRAAKDLADAWVILNKAQAQPGSIFYGCVPELSEMREIIDDLIDQVPQEA